MPVRLPREAPMPSCKVDLKGAAQVVFLLGTENQIFTGFYFASDVLIQPVQIC